MPKAILIVLLSFLLSSCEMLIMPFYMVAIGIDKLSPQSKTYTKKLPDAIIGEPYTAEITAGERDFIKLKPDDAGLQWRPAYLNIEQEEEIKKLQKLNGGYADLSKVIIYGTPAKAGVIKVSVTYYTYPNMVSSSKEINTVYKIKVNAP